MSKDRSPRWPEWLILLTMIGAAGFAAIATGAIRPADFAVVEILMAAGLVVCVLQTWLRHRLEFHLSPLLWAVMGFTLYGFIRWQTADIFYLAENEWTKVLLYAAFFVVISQYLTRPHYTQILYVSLTAIAVASCLYAMYQYFTGSDRVMQFIRPAQYTRRGSGTFINPNNFGGYMAVLLPVVTAFIIAGRAKITLRMLGAYGALMIVGGLIVSASRGALISAGAGVLMLVVLLFRQRAFRLPAALCLAVLVLGGIGFLAKAELTIWRWQQIGSTNLESNTRVLLWQSASDMWHDHFWWGVGPAGYDAFFPQYRPPILQKIGPEFAHNEYINTLADYGLAGALLVLLALVMADVDFRRGWKLLRREAADLDGARSNRLALLLGAAGGITAALVHAFFDYNFHMPAYALLVVGLLAVITVVSRPEDSRWWWKPKSPGKVVMSLLLVGTAGWLGWHGQRSYQEANLLEKWELTDINSPEYMKLLQSAHALNPKNAKTVYEIGEYYRALSWTGDDHYKEEGKQALEWYAQASKLNPQSASIPLRQAMTLTWIEDFKGAQPFMAEAERLDPKDYFLLAHIGWCYFQQGNYPAAWKYFQKSLALRGYDNLLAETYAPLTKERLSAEVTRGPAQ